MTRPPAGDRTGAAGTPEPVPHAAGALVVLGVAALLLVTGGWLLPLWEATLHAPQYPGGLSMSAYGHQVTGDIDEIDGLNHYVGMRAFDPETVPEMRLWPLALAVAALAVVVGLLRRWGTIGRLARIYLWLLPVGVLAMVQFRLHQYGRDLDPGAALRLDPFTPWVVGPTKVWNFTTWARPGAGLIALMLAAAVVSFGPRLLGRPTPRPLVGPTAVVAVLVLGVVSTTPAWAADGTGHAGHGTRGGQATHDAGPDDRAPRIGPSHGPGGPPSLSTYPDVGPLAEVLAAHPAGAEVILPAGTYRGPLVIDRPVTIEGRDLPILLGDGTGTVLTIRAPGTVIRGIAIGGSGPGPTGNPAAIRIEADDVTIEGVTVFDSYVGIAVDGASGVRLLDNHLHGRADARILGDEHAVADHDDHRGDAPATAGRGDGIWLHEARNVLIRGNHIADTRDGIYLSFGSDTLVDGNHVHGARYAVHSMFTEHLTLAENHAADNLSGAVLMYGRDVLLLRNHIERSNSASTGFGVLLKDVVNVQAVENILNDNRVGIHLDGPAGADSDTRFTANTVARNTVGVQAYSSATATFRANSFAHNLIQVLPQGGRLDGIAWAAEGWGNHWTSYRGYDANGLGRGALPHTEGGAVDRLLARNPELIAIADSPALRLLRSVEERWGRRVPVLTDELPLTRPVSPSLEAPPPEPLARSVALLLGSALAAPLLVLVVRRPVRLARPSRRSLRAAA
jgi:nitrous oxidase accessory protein